MTPFRKRPFPRALLPAIAAAAALAAPPAEAARPCGRVEDGARARAGGRESLQTLLERLRAQREAVLAEKRAGYQALLAELDQHVAAHDEARLAETRKKLVALGPESVSLFAEGLDPGHEPDEATRRRASSLAEALAEMPTSSITDRLLELARTGSLEGRLNALSVLARSPEPARVVPVLAGLWPSSEGPLRQALLATLAAFGGAEAELVLGEALASADAAVASATLHALASARNASVAPEVAALLGKTRDPARLEGLIAYYRACPEAADKTHVLGLVGIAQDFTVATELRSRILALLPALIDRADSDVRKALRVLGDAPSGEVRDAALVALSLFGDKGARRDLISYFDDQIERNKNWHQNWDARASMLYRIGEYRDALKDWQQALKIAGDDPRARVDPYWLGVARCQAQLGKHKDAAQALERTSLTSQQLADLALDPAFAKMAKDPKYKGVFRIE